MCSHTTSRHGVPYPIAGIEPYDTAAGLRAFGHPWAPVLNTLHHNDFRYQRC